MERDDEGREPPTRRDEREERPRPRWLFGFDGWLAEREEDAFVLA